MKKILIVDDHTIVRQGLIRTLQDALELPSSFDEASDAQQAGNMVNANEYDLVLLDISLSDQNGLILLKHLHKQKPKLPVIIMSTHPEEQYYVRTLRAGAFGYVNKGSSTAVFKEAIEKVLAGKEYVSQSQADLLVEAICDNSEYEVKRSIGLKEGRGHAD